MPHVEGKLSVLSALTARRRRIEVILVRHGAHTENFGDVLDLAAQLGVPVRHVESRELDAMAHGNSHGGIVAVCSAKPRTTVDELFELLDSLTEAPLLLLLEGVDDQRNLGFTIRSAEALGAHAILIKKHLWDFDDVEVARPASGAFERMPLVQIDDVAPLERLQRRGLRIIGCLPSRKKTMYDTDLTRGTILAIGGEKRGISGAVRKICNGKMAIPTKPEPSSLSLSHAAAIVLAEAMRQRMTTGGSGRLFPARPEQMEPFEVEAEDVGDAVDEPI